MLEARVSEIWQEYYDIMEPSEWVLSSNYKWMIEWMNE